MLGGGRGLVGGGCALALAIPLALPAVAAADLTLRDPTPRTITAKQLQAGRQKVVVCDRGSRPARDLQVKFQHFALLQQGKPVRARDVLEPTHPGRHAVAPGSCVGLRIALRPHVTTDPGVATGTLVVSSTAGSARLPLTLGSRDASPVQPAPGANATLELRAERGLSFGDAHLVDGGVLALRVTTPGQPPALPAPGTALGLLAVGTHRAVITRAPGDPQPQPDDPDVWLLRVRIHNLNHMGDYSGTLDLAPAGAAPVEVAVKLTATDTWLKPALVTVLGVLLAFAAQLWIRNWRVRFRWRMRRRDLVDLYGDARQAFQQDPAEGVELTGPSGDAVRDYTRQIERAIKRSGNFVTFLDASSPAYKEIVKSLDLAERDAACLASWGGYGSGLGERLEQLADEAQRVLALVNQVAGAELPACVTHAAALMKGELKVGGALELMARVQQQTAYMRRWRGLLVRLQRYDRWWRHLSAASVDPAADRIVGPEDERTLRCLGVTLRRAQVELFDAGEEGELTRSGVEQRLLDAGRQLACLRELYWSPSMQGPPGTLPEGADIASMDDKLDADGDGHDLVHLVGAATTIQVRPAQPVSVLRNVRLLGDLLVVLFSVAVGVLGMLVLFYFGKTFGTIDDYLAAFATGASSQILVSSLAETLGLMREADQAALVVEPSVEAALAGVP